MLTRAPHADPSPDAIGVAFPGAARQIRMAVSLASGRLREGFRFIERKVRLTFLYMLQ